MKTTKLFIVGVIGAIAMQTPLTCAAKKSMQQLQDLYKKIGTDLGTIKKEYAPVQPRIYSLLDQVEKMYNIAKTSVQKRKNLKKNLKAKTGELVKITQELVILKKEASLTKQKFDNTFKQLETEKSQLLSFNKERSELLTKLAKLEAQHHEFEQKKEHESANKLAELKDSELKEHALKELQSLTLSSTSAPNSPR